MQEQRGLIEQPLGGFDALDHDAARHGVELRVLLRREFAAGEHHDRHFRERRIGADLLQHLEARHVRQPQVENDAVARLLAQRCERLRAGADRNDLDVVVAEQLGDAHLLGRIVLDDEQTLAARLGVFLDARQRVFETFRRRRLGHERECAARESVPPVLVERDDLHRDVAGCRVLLELAQHRPAEHVGQEHVERNCGRLVLLGEIQRLGAARGDQHPETPVAGEIDHDPRIVRIVLDDQQGIVARLDFETIVRDGLDRPFDERAGVEPERRHG